MEEQRTVVLYGNSLLLAGVEASLKGRDGLKVMRVDASLFDAEQRLRALHPDVVVFDLVAPRPKGMVALLRLNPSLSFIGLDLDSKTAVVLSGRSRPATTASELVEVIHDVQ